MEDCPIEQSFSMEQVHSALLDGGCAEWNALSMSEVSMDRLDWISWKSNWTTNYHSLQPRWSRIAPLNTQHLQPWHRATPHKKKVTSHFNWNAPEADSRHHLTPHTFPQQTAGEFNTKRARFEQLQQHRICDRVAWWFCIIVVSLSAASSRLCARFLESPRLIPGNHVNAPWLLRPARAGPGR